MGRIQSDVGLLSGIEIGKTVEKLMAIAARPRDLLKKRTDLLNEEKLAISQLSALLLAVKFPVVNLGKPAVFDKREAVSSDSSVLSATVTGSPVNGTYQFTPLRTVQSQQWLSSSFASQDQPIGAGAVSFRFGPHVQRSLSLETLNGGRGVPRGMIRITDRSGARADIDLSTARTIDDVLDAINNNTTINVTALAVGDRIRLVDNTGQSVSNLKVQEVGSGQTAAALGLAGIDTPQSTADGADIVSLGPLLPAAIVNDGHGIRIDKLLPEISFTLRDGTQGTIDFSAEDDTIGKILDRINAAAPGKLTATIADGDRLVLTDSTSGGNQFQLTALYGAQTLADLGLNRPAQEGTITGRRLLGGLRSVLLAGLNGGQSFGSLGQISITDRSGAQTTADLSIAETLEDVVNIINAATGGAGVRVSAAVNRARNGIELLDTTNATASNLIIASNDATQTAEKLKIAVNDAVSSVNSGDLHLRIISENTPLAALNGGAGVRRDRFYITDTTGRRITVNLANQNIVTVGDVIRTINSMTSNVRAEINPTGDGIRLVDTARGSGTLRVQEGNSTTAADLHLLAEASYAEVDGQQTLVIDGKTTYTVNISASDSLSAVAEKINSLGAGLRATVVSDGSFRPYRLQIISERPGSAGNLAIDDSQAGWTVTETIRGQDALLLVGQPENIASGLLLWSSSNRYENALPGVRLEVKKATGQSVNVTVQSTDVEVVASVKAFVEGYNKFRAKLKELTAYDAENKTAGILAGDAAALRLDSDLGRLITDRFLGVGRFQSLAELGISVQQDGQLSFDETRLREALAADPESVRKFFTSSDAGLSARFSKLIDQLAESERSLLSSRLKAVSDKIDDNQRRLERMNTALSQEQERLYNMFYRLETAIARLQSNMNYIGQIRYIDILTNPTNNRR